jgi:hypothetical protein
MRSILPMRTITHVEKDALAQKVLDDWLDFQVEISPKKPYPREKFYAFFHSAWRYAEVTRRHRLIHGKIVGIMNGLVEGMQVERKRFPGKILYDADRLETLFFCGYDPHFEGDEPPGL